MCDGTTTAPAVSVVVLHRSPMIASGLVHGLRALGLSATTGDGSPAREGGAHPDVLVLDDRTSENREEHLVERHRGPLTRLLVVVGRTEPRVDGAACGHVRRSQTVQELAGAIKRVARGHHVTAPRRLVDNSSQLTPRERDVLALLASGARNDQVAAALDISPHTVRTHVQNLLAKLEVTNRLAAVTLARRRGLLAAPASVAR